MGRRRSQLIPDEVLIPAIIATMEDDRYKGKCVDNWGEAERSHCRTLCGKPYLYIETDWIMHAAINHRKGSRLKKVNGGHAARKLVKPSGEYAKYLAGEHWQTFRLEVLTFWFNKCCLCSDAARDVHHNTYKSLGQEALTDCVPLCRECHKRVHGRMPDGNSVVESQPKEKTKPDMEVFQLSTETPT